MNVNEVDVKQPVKIAREQVHQSNVLLDQRLFLLNDKDYEAFEQALQAPVSPPLKSLLKTRAPREQQ